VINLVPIRVKSTGPTDGRQLLRLLFHGKADQLRSVHHTLFRPMLPENTQIPEPSAEMPEIAYQVTRRDRLWEPWARRDASDAMRLLLARDRLPKAERALVLSFLVSNELLFGGTGLTPGCLDIWSLEALVLAPTPATRVDRAEALVALGQVESAKSMLLCLLDVPMDETDAIICRACLAQAASIVGDDVGARRWMDEARASVTSANESTLLPILAYLQSDAAASA
jgi:hypothetical protein